MNQYECYLCKNQDDCIEVKSQAVRDVSIRCGLTCHSDFQSERDTVLDIGEILESLCKTDLYWYNKGVTEGEDVGKCRGKDCNYCGRYNEKLRQSKQDGE